MGEREKYSDNESPEPLHYDEKNSPTQLDEKKDYLGAEVSYPQCHTLTTI